MKSTLLTILFLCIFWGTGAQQDSEKDKKTIVLVCMGKYAKSYHSHECRGLKNCKHEIIKTTLEEAKKKGYKPCGYCYKKQR